MSHPKTWQERASEAFSYAAEHSEIMLLSNTTTFEDIYHLATEQNGQKRFYFVGSRKISAAIVGNTLYIDLWEKTDVVASWKMTEDGNINNC